MLFTGDIMIACLTREEIKTGKNLELGNQMIFLLDKKTLIWGILKSDVLDNSRVVFSKKSPEKIFGEVMILGFLAKNFGGNRSG